jgi:hypothetical protein
VAATQDAANPGISLDRPSSRIPDLAREGAWYRYRKRRPYVIFWGAGHRSRSKGSGSDHARVFFHPRWGKACRRARPRQDHDAAAAGLVGRRAWRIKDGDWDGEGDASRTRNCVMKRDFILLVDAILMGFSKNSLYEVLHIRHIAVR